MGAAGEFSRLVWLIVESGGCESKCGSGDCCGILGRDSGVQCGQERGFAGWKGSIGLGSVECFRVLRLVAMFLAQDGGLCGRIVRGFVESFGLEFVYLAGTAGRSDVEVGFWDECPGFFVDFADHLGGAASDAHALAVGGGEAKAFEESIGAPFVDAAGGERVDDAGDGNLDGLAVLQRGEIEERVAGDKRGPQGDFVTEDVVAAVEAAVEVTEYGVCDSDTVALEAVGLDVAA